jgi:hypothetical protein
MTSCVAHGNPSCPNLRCRDDIARELQPTHQTAKPQVSVLDVLDSFDVLKKVYGPWIAPINHDHDALVDKLVSERVVGTAKKRALKP